MSPSFCLGLKTFKFHTFLIFPIFSGFYCPSEPGKPSTRSRQIPCGSVNKYCPEHSGSPRDVDIGYFTTGGFGVNSSMYRTNQRVCPMGSYCIDGTKFPCPSGVWGDSLGLSSRMCSGFCPAGFYCEEGTSQPKECPDDSYSSEGWSKCISCTSRIPGLHRCKNDRDCCHYM